MLRRIATGLAVLIVVLWFLMTFVGVYASFYVYCKRVEETFFAR